MARIDLQGALPGAAVALVEADELPSLWLERAPGHPTGPLARLAWQTPSGLPARAVWLHGDRASPLPEVEAASLGLVACSGAVIRREGQRAWRCPWDRCGLLRAAAMAALGLVPGHVRQVALVRDGSAPLSALVALQRAGAEVLMAPQASLSPLERAASAPVAAGGAHGWPRVRWEGRLGQERLHALAQLRSARDSATGLLALGEAGALRHMAGEAGEGLARDLERALGRWRAEAAPLERFPAALMEPPAGPLDPEAAAFAAVARVWAGAGEEGRRQAVRAFLAGVPEAEAVRATL